MTSGKIKKVKLKGNESFNFREGWLRKGMRCVANCDVLFSQNDVMEQLGVGSKMVKSIRFWLQATSLCEEKNTGRARTQYLTKDFGEVISEYDPYFDDSFTLFLIHYHIISNEELCMAWNIFFNEFEGQDFSKEDMVETCKSILDKKMDEGCTYSEKSFQDDCASIIKMYQNDENTRQPIAKNQPIIILPEDSLACPLVELGLLQNNKIKHTYFKTSPSKDLLDKLAVLYVITKNLILNNKTSVSIDDLLKAPNNIGKVFNLNRVSINEYLDQLRISGYLTINRTAGLDMVYIESMMDPRDIMVEYYKKAQGK